MAKTNGFTLLGRELIYCSKNLHRCENQFMQTSVNLSITTTTTTRHVSDVNLCRNSIRRRRRRKICTVPSEKSKETCRTQLWFTLHNLKQFWYKLERSQDGFMGNLQQLPVLKSLTQMGDWGRSLLCKDFDKYGNFKLAGRSPSPSIPFADGGLAFLLVWIG